MLPADRREAHRPCEKGRPLKTIISLMSKVCLLCVFPIWRNTIALSIFFNEKLQDSSLLEKVSSRPLSSAAIVEVPVLDIISIGSQIRPEQQDAQERTFASHAAVRNFHRITEHNDTDASCAAEFGDTQLEMLTDYCTKQAAPSVYAKTIREFFMPRTNGWMCAQKRPIDGLNLVLNSYKNNLDTIPDYFTIIDDDSYLYVDALLPIFQTCYPESERHVLSGCRMYGPENTKFIFPYGGFGSIFTREAINNLMRPIYCNAADKDVFTKFACWRIDLNLVGERPFFREGMSIADFLYTFSSAHPFTQIEKWKKGSGFCFHSDHALAFFVAFYHVSVPEEYFHEYDTQAPDDSVRKQFGYENLALGKSRIAECKFERSNCDPKRSRICHYIEPNQMDDVFAAQKQLHGGIKDVQPTCNHGFLRNNEPWYNYWREKGPTWIY